MNRRGPRSSNDKTENKELAEQRRIPHNPFQANRRAAKQPKRPFAGLLCIVPSLFGFVALNKYHNAKFQRASIRLYPRIFQHDNDDWFLPKLDVNTRMYPREAHRLREEQAKEVNDRNKIVSRRIITSYKFDDTHLMGPMESSDSEESSSEEDEKDKDSQDYADGLHVESKGIECEYQDWQMETPVACNSVDEVDMRPRSDSFFLLGCGGDRCAFKVADYDEHLPIVLKASR